MLGITEEKLDKKNNNSDDTEQIELDTKFYGRIKISKKQKLIFTQGLYGFENLKEYYIIDFNGGPFYWLQSGENPDIAFVVIEPTTFMKDYRLEINPSDFEEIGLKTKQEIKDYLKVLVIITIPENPEKMTANLIGPIIINKRDGIAMQALALNNDYTTKHLVLEELEKLQGRET